MVQAVLTSSIHGGGYAAGTPRGPAHSRATTGTITKVDILTGNLIDDLVIDRAAIVRAGVEIEILLDLPAELEQVVALHESQVIAQHLVLAVPDPLARALVVYVIRN